MKVLDEIGFWDWKKLYEFDPTKLPDGYIQISCPSSIDIKISFKNRILQTRCCEGEPETMDEFLDALQELMGLDITGREDYDNEI